MNWWILALLSGAGLAGRNILYKISTGKIDAAMAAMLLSISMSVVAIGYFIYQRVSQNEPFISNVTFDGAFFAVVAGGSLAAANIFLAFSYKAGGLASIVGILQNGFALSLTVLLGVFLLGEHIKILQIIGVLTTAAGVFMIVKG